MGVGGFLQMLQHFPSWFHLFTAGSFVCSRLHWGNARGQGGGLVLLGKRAEFCTQEEPRWETFARESCF